MNCKHTYTPWKTKDVGRVIWTTVKQRTCTKCGFNQTKEVEKDMKLADIYAVLILAALFVLFFYLLAIFSEASKWII